MEREYLTSHNGKSRSMRRLSRRAAGLARV